MLIRLELRMLNRGPASNSFRVCWRADGSPISPYPKGNLERRFPGQRRRYVIYHRGRVW